MVCLFTQLLSLNGLARHLLTSCKNKWQRANNSVGKERCINEHIVFGLLYVSCIYKISHRKNCFGKLLSFPNGVKFCAKFEVTTKTMSVSRHF